MVDDVLQFCKVSVLMLLVQCCLDLLNGEETIGIGVDLLEEKTKAVDVLLR